MSTDDTCTICGLSPAPTEGADQRAHGYCRAHLDDGAETIASLTAERDRLTRDASTREADIKTAASYVLTVATERDRLRAALTTAKQDASLAEIRARQERDLRHSCEASLEGACRELDAARAAKGGGRTASREHARQPRDDARLLAR